MRLDWIEDILAVHETGSFAGAAEVRFLTPSAFTRRIRTIEEALGCDLFDRSKKPITLKRHVHDSLPELRDAVVTLKRTRQLLSQPDMDLNKRVTVISQHALTASFAPRLLTQPALRDAPNIRIKSGRKSECLLQLIKRKADFALVYEVPGDKTDLDADHCHRMELGKEVFLPVIHESLLPEFAQGILPDKLPMIAFPPSIFLGEVLRSTLSARPMEGPELFTVAETGLSLAVVEFVKRGVGVGWLPLSMAEAELHSGTLVSLEHVLPKFELNVTLLRLTNELPQAARELWATMESTFAEVLPI